MEPHIYHSRYRQFKLGSVAPLADDAIAEIIEILDQRSVGLPGVLGGRAVVGRGQVRGFGAVVVKKYHRGGALGRLVRGSHLRYRNLRSESELHFLVRVRALGLNAPEPIAYIVRGGLIYHTWLVMKEIPEQASLVELARADDSRLVSVLDEVVRQVTILIRNRIAHIDLHPGNILFGKDDKVYLVDFDKARLWRRSSEELRDRYLNRWRRAVIKHSLPEELVEVMSLGLRRNDVTYAEG